MDRMKFMKSALKRIARKLVGAAGFDLVKTNRRALIEQRLLVLRRNGFKPNVVVDGGAYQGHWTKEVSQMFPSAKFVVVEPNPFLSEKIAANLGPQITYEFIPKALGAQPGTAKLNVWDADHASGSSICEHVKGAATELVDCEMTDLDSLIALYDQVPDLIKLDLQGYELEALKGATRCLEKTEVFITEFGCTEAYIDRTTVHKLIDFMDKKDYVLYDIFGLQYRPYDQSLGGGDFIFVRKDSQLKKYKGWA